MSECEIVCAKCGGPLDAVTAEMAREAVSRSPDITMPWCYGCAHPARLPGDMLSPCCAATRLASTDIFVRFLLRQGLGPLGKLTGREFAAHVAGGILATEVTSVSLEEVAALDEASPVEVAENRRSANVLRGAGWVETPEGWRSGSAAPLPLIEAFAELLRQMKSSP